MNETGAQRHNRPADQSDCKDFISPKAFDAHDPWRLKDNVGDVEEGIDVSELIPLKMEIFAQAEDFGVSYDIYRSVSITAENEQKRKKYNTNVGPVEIIEDQEDKALRQYNLVKPAQDRLLCLWINVNLALPGALSLAIDAGVRDGDDFLLGHGFFDLLHLACAFEQIPIEGRHDSGSCCSAGPQRALIRPPISTVSDQASARYQHLDTPLLYYSLKSMVLSRSAPGSAPITVALIPGRGDLFWPMIGQISVVVLVEVGLRPKSEGRRC